MDCSDTIPQIENSIAKVISFDPEIKRTIGMGTGFVFSDPGIIVTCNHVVENPRCLYFLKFPDSNEFIPAKTLLRDEEHDLTLLGIENSNRTPLVVYEGQVKKGLEVLFSGYPLGLAELTTHQGIISSISKDATGVATYLIDGTVNPGNSGCPLMSKEGMVIGVVNAQKRESLEILDKVEKMNSGAISVQGVDLVDIYKALMSNLQLGIGYAIPASYIPSHKEIKENGPLESSNLSKKEVRNKK